MSSLSLWIDQHREDVTDLSDYDVGKWMLFGPDAVESFDDFEFGPKNFPNFVVSFIIFEEFRSNSVSEKYGDVIVERVPQVNQRLFRKQAKK